MKIFEITEQTVHYVEVEGEDNNFFTYRRCSADDWEELMGWSWEPVLSERVCYLLETEFQKYKLNQDV